MTQFREPVSRLLIVGIQDSPHLHRWARMISRSGTTILVFPTLSNHYPLPEGFNYVDLDDVTPTLPSGVWFVLPSAVRSARDDETNRRWGYEPWVHSWVQPDVLASPERLAECICRFRPHVLHGMETQLAGYLCAETARRIGPAFPFWIQSTWGSDLNLFRKLPGHPERLENVFRRVQLHLADCARDRVLARSFGYAGPDMPVIPASGGMDIEQTSRLATIPPSKRRVVIVKGYQNWAGRGLIALSALTTVVGRLSGYRVGVLASGAVVAAWSRHITSLSDIEVEALPYVIDQRDALIRLSEARVVVGIGISDGLPTTMLEAMTLGAFPIQSSSGCCGEWIESGKTGIIVSPHDTREIADALVRALSDDDLVDAAAVENLSTVRQRWDVTKNAKVVWEIYESLVKNRD